ncbi:hypothetical protein [Tautonia sociabilis]|uniref:Uncharacterized protein n=1 Tax=Tautonia sociabilis TaxID=2080755 RepID=A0A432MIF0_9BACT|nr:hypothetical protein [Tautonia sociabilis]RUL87000.1 hypothetical protein TsocGM_14480 [Tautonia sociabilis]
MDEGKWTVKSYAGAKGERMWAVVHRERPMFLAIVADRSVDALCEVPPAAVYWAKPEVPDDAASYRRRAIEVLRQRRDASPPHRPARPNRRVKGRGKSSRATGTQPRHARSK